MKKYYIFALILFSAVASAQQKMLTKTGKITFEASVPAFEEVKGTTQTATCILNTETGEIAALALIKSFRFKVALMEEHFNENYLESNQYPKATFKGKIAGFSASQITSTAANYTINGTMEMHGKSKPVTIVAKIRKTTAGVEIISSFYLNADDFAIEIPSVVKSKVSKKVQVQTEFLLK